LSLADIIYQKSLELPADKAIEVIDFIDFIKNRNETVSRAEPITESLTMAYQEGGKKCLNARELLASNIIGLWKDRDDIADSAKYARQLRYLAQKRQ